MQVHLRRSCGWSWQAIGSLTLHTSPAASQSQRLKCNGQVAHRCPCLVHPAPAPATPASCFAPAALCSHWELESSRASASARTVRKGWVCGDPSAMPSLHSREKHLQSLRTFPQGHLQEAGQSQVGANHSPLAPLLLAVLRKNNDKTCFLSEARHRVTCSQWPLISRASLSWKP